MNLAHLLERAARDHPHAPALAWGKTVLKDHVGLLKQVSAMAAGMLGLGLQPGDRVGLVMRNHPTYWESLLAIWHAGLVISQSALHLCCTRLAIGHWVALAWPRSFALCTALVVFPHIA